MKNTTSSSSPEKTLKPPSSTSSIGELKPFLFQVAGHGGILRVSQDRLYKPLVTREHEFYKSLPEDSPLRGFVPKYYGTTTITREQVYKQQSFDSIQSAAQLENIVFTDDSSPWINTAKKRRSGNPIEVSETLEEWSKTEEKLTYVIMEDLTSQFTRPSVLDIKMGTRQHTFATDPEKKASLEAKCKNTTTAELGIRHCGTQVYRRDQSQYLLRDKYFGRKLNQETLMKALEEYLYNGKHVVWEVIPAFVERLEKLLYIFENDCGYHFFSSSLLFMYEGASDGVPSFDIRMVDFAHVYRNSEPCVPEDFDAGYTRGLKSLIGILTKIYEKHKPKSNQ